MNINKFKQVIASAAFIFLAFTIAKSQTDSKNFVGTWNLSKTKTTVKDLPKELKNYKIIIAQLDNKINIKDYVDGAIEPRFENSRASSGGARPQDGIWGDSRGNTNTGLSVKPNYGGSMVLSKYFTQGEVAYIFDAKESEIDILQDGNKIGSAKVKAKMEKDGNSFKINTVRKMKTMKAGQTEMTIYVREKWDLVEDGKTLKYVKTVELPNAIDEAILYFTKE